MNLPALLDVGLGLTVVYFLFATIASTIVELIAAWGRWRHNLLRRAIAKLLNGSVDAAHAGKKPSDLFWAHPTIAALGALDKNGPGSIASDRFATAVIDMLIGEAATTVPPSRDILRVLVAQHASEHQHLSTALLALLRTLPPEAPDPLAAFRAAVARWYDEGMQRASGTYKRKVQRTLFWTGFTCALVLNIDTIRITQLLYRNPDMRKAVGDFAAETAKNQQPPVEQKLDPDIGEARKSLSKELKQVQDLARIGFPVGWVMPNYMNFSPLTKEDDPRGHWWWTFAVFAKIFGLLATAFAICLGAPFWFDLLNRLVKLRSGGSNEKTNPDNTAPASASNGNSTSGPAGQLSAIPGASVIPVAALARAVEPPGFAAALADPRIEFSPRKAFRLAQAANYAYDDDPKNPFQTIALTTWFCTEFHLFSDAGVPGGTDTQAYLLVAPNVAVLVFRGTESKVQDWLTDAKCGLTKTAPFAGKIHQGFAAAHAARLAEIKAKLTALKDSGRMLYVVGHSLGGALATLAACQIAKEGLMPVQSVYTFGCPRVGDNEFATAYEALLGSRTFRVVNNEDVVTRVPPPAPNLDYKHVGQMIYIDDAGRLQRDIGFWYRALNFAANAVADFKAAAKQTIADHSMKFYCGHLEVAARQPVI